MSQMRVFRDFATILFVFMGLWTACTPSELTPTTLRPATPSAFRPTPSQEVTPDKPNPNFAFQFEYGTCLLESFDSFKGIFTRSMGPSEAAISIPLELTAEQMEHIFQQLIAIDLFNYPGNFSVPTPEAGAVVVVTPAYHYFIRVRNGDRLKSVSWTDNLVEPNPPAADQLRRLFQMIRAILWERDEIKQLPTPKVGCV